MLRITALVLLTISTPAAADIVSASPNGFEVRQTVPLAVTPEVAFSSFGSLPAWWDPAHTYSKKAENLSLTLTPGGCLCERFDGAGIEHLHVVYVDPGKHIIFTGALGPLLSMAVNGVLDVQIKSAAGGSVLTLDYRASGFYNGGADKIAPAVDGMLAGQMKRFRAYATARPRT